MYSNHTTYMNSCFCRNHQSEFHRHMCLYSIFYHKCNRVLYYQDPETHMNGFLISHLPLFCSLYCTRTIRPTRSIWHQLVQNMQLKSNLINICAIKICKELIKSSNLMNIILLLVQRNVRISTGPRQSSSKFPCLSIGRSGVFVIW